MFVSFCIRTPRRYSLHCYTYLLVLVFRRRSFSLRPPSPVSNSDSAAQASSIFAHCSSLHSLLLTLHSLVFAKSRRFTTRLKLDQHLRRTTTVRSTFDPSISPISNVPLPSLKTRQAEREPTKRRLDHLSSLPTLFDPPSNSTSSDFPTSWLQPSV